ncbi:heterokaryon incompatibility protein-domain-containing protein [Hypoxylon sp. NC1633]|nr:heterokaryon incompatibility protein-domain-containing protein [Hypoxylon sp. NC1633]
MRLLNAKTLKLAEFVGSSIPPYAILSHTWECGEVLFDDLRTSRKDAAKKPGFSKVSAAAAQALRDGLDFIWVDTCCIDKKSSAELSEAINSMFLYYQASKVCYAYLSDFDLAFGKLSKIGRARWFTRGWTLQELLAPKQVQFFDRNWALIGTKQSLAKELSEITLIGIPYLSGTNIRAASIAQRMSWASNRITTRQEDLAYCLMGIFGVNMPLLYGEGQRAFRRLQEEILKYSTDESIFCWRDPTEYEPCGLLAESPHDFLHSASIISWPETGRSFENSDTSVETDGTRTSSRCTADSLRAQSALCAGRIRHLE